MIVTSKHLAFGAFLGSTALTGASLALMHWWAVQQAVWTLALGIGALTVAAGVAFGQPGNSLDRRMAQNRTYLSLSKSQIGPALGPVMPSPHRNNHSRTWPATARRRS